MSVQTTYGRYFKARIPGQESDAARTYKREALNKSSADLDVGIGVIQDTTTDSGVNVPSTATQPLVGIVLNDFGRNPNGLTTGAYAQNKMAPMLCEGPVTVQIDQDCKPSDKVFVRFAASANAQVGVVGSFRKDSDGVAQVSTGTPTAGQNSTIFLIRVKFDGKAQGTRPETYAFEYVSDSSMTATEAVTGFKTVMAADAAFTARVVATGTTTLILTGQVAGEAFTVTSEGDGAITWAATTPPAPTARYVPARWLSTGKATDAVGEIYFSAAHETP